MSSTLHKLSPSPKGKQELKTITVEIPVTLHVIDLAHSILSTAVESGIGYWCLLKSYDWSNVVIEGKERLRVSPLQGWEQEDRDKNDKAFKGAPQFKLSAEDLVAALGRLVGDAKMPAHWRSLALQILTSTPERDDVDYDAESADVFVQYAVLGQITYG